jgi:hypothetical protein
MLAADSMTGSTHGQFDSLLADEVVDHWPSDDS